MKKPKRQIVFWGDVGRLLLDLGKLAVGIMNWRANRYNEREE